MALLAFTPGAQKEATIPPMTPAPAAIMRYGKITRRSPGIEEGSGFRVQWGVSGE
jgi:hypothetical protein